MSIIESLKQRKMFQWAAAYLAGAWVLMQLIDVLGSRWGVSDEAARVIDVVLIVGFFTTLVIAWYHGDQGKQRVSGPELLIIATLFALGAMAIGLLNINTAPSSPSSADSNSPQRSASGQVPWIAVLPFEAQTPGAELEGFAAGMTEDISTGLSDFSYLMVLSRSVVTGLAAETDDVRQIGSELGARYVLQGALRKVGSTTRVTVQLVDAINGTQVWAETYDRELAPDEMLTAQDELTNQIVASVGDPAGVVVRTLAASADQKPADEMTAYESVLSYFLFQQRISADSHLTSRAALERAVEADPGYADAWTSLSLIYQQEYMNNLNPLPGSLERGIKAAQKAVDLDPASSRAHFALAQVSYFMQDLSAFQVHAKRAIELNPRNTDTMAMVGIMMGYAGEWERGVEINTAAMKLNPHHAGWYNFNLFFNAYRLQKYEEALNIAQRINLPEYWAYWLSLVIANAQLGRAEEAEKAVEELLRVWPAFEAEYADHGLAVWVFNQPELAEQVRAGLHKAGITLSQAGDDQ